MSHFWTDEDEEDATSRERHEVMIWPQQKNQSWKRQTLVALQSSGSCTYSSVVYKLTRLFWEAFHKSDITVGYL